ncbi:alpha/beta hydrolase [Yinghuangia seranimata]|uniref:alpha/beta hydrolase n=1 Tax=Yinghuangia seranimata TaxID=408067 RepID=UPI00248B1879|nr:alpha/beta hydrolase [Yinghuangia seranimata]MDI2127940.1 alpha/beta hydrolase [Yinghuangia seranimata]
MRGAVRVRRGVGAVVVAAVLLAGCSGAGDVKDAAKHPPSGSPLPSGGATTSVPMPEAGHISWSKCQDGFECGVLQVPLDYADPGGEKIKLELIRKKATGPDRIGSLLVNPGGPGGSGVAFARYAASEFPKNVRARYDIVGFDPRGVGRSTPVKCLSDPDMDKFTQLDQTPDSPDEERALVDGFTRFADGCKSNAGSLLGHVSTADAARDMDQIRAALGEPKLNYLGASYGTFLGATYADLFPDKVGRLVLDGAIDPSQPAVTANRIQGGGFETALNAYLDDCVAGGSCFLGPTRDAAKARISALLAQLDASPLPGDGTRRVDEAIATTGILSPLYSRDQWSDLTLALQAALRGDGKPLLELNDMYYERGSDGHYTNLMYANAAVNCLDGPPAATTPDQVKAQVPEFTQTSPTFGRALAWAGLTCGTWPTAPTGTPHTIKAPGAAPILVVGTTRDPATPYAWAQALAGQLSSGHLLTYDGDGHTAYLRGSTCVDTAVDTYLLTGTTPPDGKTCN